MKEGTLKMEEIIAQLLNGEKDVAYFGDEDAVWCIKELVADDTNSAGYSIICTVYSVYGNGNGYRYGNEEKFIPTKEDKCLYYDFDHREEATKDRAKIITKMMKTATWF